ncbi:hypothetical protein GLOTRDRAFT_108036 [Gloeophyllum trabeum ATCC 11539]|uniref:Uncharacterized protein n=1 Tax=Gloeophyllum trabeum (strain ATCC 11539 / FP-39264 / Madison 617) TaxID=670483 RepID=S7PUF7_GLOTA|nr:uncharacterized protein GLOTRDRAFT_108036 [Gloeophyllum trabeum ATCC 11539]EPQ51446.1 hypothetical protein GLOTRDRAFT_108036 [Gloeophyllum trabeum ATCC 11539]
MLNDASTEIAAPLYHPSEWERTTGSLQTLPSSSTGPNYLTCRFRRPEGRIQTMPTRTAHGVFNTPLNPVWHSVAPKISTILKDTKIRYAAIHAACFMTHGEDHQGLHRAVVEWFEGVSETLAGCALLCATDDMKPIYHVRSVAFVFHENKTRSGEPSSSVLSVSNCHRVRLASARRFRSGLKEIEKAVADLGGGVDDLADDIAVLQAKLGRDLEHRNIGHVDWAPAISVVGYRYTRDIGTFVVDAERFRGHFKGNVVDLVMEVRNSTDLTVGRFSGLEAYTSSALGVESWEIAQLKIQYPYADFNRDHF